MQDCVSAYLKALNLHWTKSFGEGYVILKSKVKQNLLVVEIDYFKKCIWNNFEKKKVSQETISYYFNKRVNYICYQVKFIIKIF